MWLIVSSKSPHNPHLLFCCVVSILALIRLVLMALFCATIRRDSISLLRFFFFALDVIEVDFFPIFVIWLFPFFCSSYCHYYFGWLWIDFLHAFFKCRLLVIVSMCQRCLPFWKKPFLFFLIHIICHLHLWEVRPYACSLVISSLVHLFKFSGSPKSILWGWLPRYFLFSKVPAIFFGFE